jgi:hypothetical protein
MSLPASSDGQSGSVRFHAAQQRVSTPERGPPWLSISVSINSSRRDG